MANRAQLELEFPRAHKAEELWTKLMERLVSVADCHGRKEVAWELDVSRKYLDTLLAQREDRQLKGEQLMFFFALDPELIVWLAGELGYEVKRRREMTDAEKASAYRAALKSLGTAGELLLERLGLE